MSGYLTRMVAAAARPERRMRPFIGSIYAASQTDGDQGGHVIDEQVTVRAAGPAAIPTTERPVPRRETPPAKAGPAAAPSPSPEPRERLAPMPLQPSAPAPIAAPAAEARAPSPPRRPTQSLAPARTQQPAEAPSPPIGEPARIERTHLVKKWCEQPPEPAGAAAPQRSEIARPAPQSASTRPTSQPPRTRAQPVREAGEDVQIHIGRIEVIASPAAPAAPAPIRRPSRSTSLQDYLKHSGRRPR